MLYLLQGEIRYGFTPLPEAVLKISTKTEKEYQDRMIRMMNDLPDNIKKKLNPEE